MYYDLLVRKKKYLCGVALQYEFFDKLFELQEAHIEEIFTCSYRGTVTLRIRLTGPRPTMLGKPLPSWEVCQGCEFSLVDLNKFLEDRHIRLEKRST